MWIRAVAEALVPRTCVLCSARFPEPVRGPVGTGLVCGACLHRLTALPAENRCARCGIPLPQLLSLCSRCRTMEYAFDRSLAVHRYGGSAGQVVRAYKFQGVRGLAALIACQMAETGGPMLRADADQPASAPVLVPVPSGPASIRARGFASAVPIAQALAALTRLPTAPALVHRGSVGQKTLSGAARLSNARRSIVRSPAVRVPERAVLVDDVFTTGATTSLCAELLREGGAREVVVLVYAMEY